MSKVYLVGANPCKVVNCFESRREAKSFCDLKNKTASKYFYEVKSIDIIKQGQLIEL